MKRRICWALLLGLVGCTADRDAERSGVIRLSTTFEASAVSRGVVVNEMQLAGVQFLRLDGSTAPSSFAGAKVLSGLRSAEGGITFDGADPIYDNDDKNAYFVAFHPEGVTASEVVTWGVDGKTDILLTPTFDAGNKEAPISGPMTFKHRLAQLAVVCKADPNALVSQEVIQLLWGKITKIELEGTPSELTYTYATNLVGAGATLVGLPLLQKDYDTAFEPVAIVKENTEVTAAGMFVPTVTTDKLKIKVYTETEPLGKVIEVQLKEGETPKGFEVGKCHTVTLTFKGADKNIELLATEIEGWKPGYVGEGVLEK